eukprot:5359200-Alexandrium_andersonii.AAC.1
MAGLVACRRICAGYGGFGASYDGLLQCDAGVIATRLGLRLGPRSPRARPCRRADHPQRLSCPPCSTASARAT